MTVGCGLNGGRFIVAHSHLTLNLSKFWEPTKLAATLRHEQDASISGPVFLRIDMSSGHFSSSDRYKYLKEIAFRHSFLFDQLGVADKVCSMAQ
jgi:protease II